jgi:VanZ family protein
MKLVKYWGPTVVLMATIFFFSTRTKVTVSDEFLVQFAFFKTLHVLEYGLLYILSYRSIKNTTTSVSWRESYWAFLFSVIYGVSDEIHQVFVPTREGAGRDVFIDTIGITLAFFIVWKLLPKAPKKLLTLGKKLELI